jgi:D-inositol-3-phosphate glycosyltransferase
MTMQAKNLKIALISEHASPLALTGSVDVGGQNIYVAHIASGLADLGHEVDIFTRRDRADLPNCVNLRPGVRVFHVEAGPASFVPKEELLPHMPAFTAAVNALFERQGRSKTIYDVIHANFFMSGWVGLALREKWQVPLVTTFHALGLVRREHQKEADRFLEDRIEIERTLASDSNCVIAQCPQDKLDLERLYGVQPQRLTTIPCGVDTTTFKPGDKLAARQRLGLCPDEFIVLQLGRLVPRKGIETVVRSLAYLPKQTNARLVVVGGESAEPDETLTPEIGRLRKIARSLNIESRLTFAGRRERHELRDWHVAADVFVTTPWYEPFGITPLEAMACGTPVIGTAVGGVQYTVSDQITGYLIPPYASKVLADRLLTIYHHPAMATAMGKAGVKRVHTHFTWQHVVQQLAALYDSVASAKEKASSRQIDEEYLSNSASRPLPSSAYGMGNSA